MPTTSSLVKKLRQLYPQFDYQKADDYRWSPGLNTVFFKSDQQPDFLLHELAHAVLGHRDYGYDIELLPMERDAWDKALEIAEELGLGIKEDVIESNLDSYRNWMHARSTCPSCGATGVQTKKSLYSCPACTTTWRVNDARICGLKRYRINK